ncbi:MAG: D-methionine transport system permease protein [Acetobacterium sp.]|jgi:D-methionine transport system permease protein|uniref:methionine ABC transporter permease n=1 Tax=Acetobacterium sp. K1/6 TaxID=3055467 RepID=UPI0029DF8043|nr:methionine ABC transporter permease [Acetobacterium sp. K1/6]MDK2940788.1 D-methionine transport system permease protein [Acetobacterium sp.]MDZ5726544.1 methionine ABC transporter permease [Acetobacterium sp. K1/6]
MDFDLKAALLLTFGQTMQMVISSLLAAIIIGGSIGLLLFLTSNTLFLKNRIINQIVGVVINITRSIPFLILLVLMIPVSKAIVHTSIGPNAVVIPLAVAAIAFFGRLSEASFSDVDNGVLEAAIASGASKLSIVLKILLPEALPSLIKNITVTAVSLIGFSAMAGTVGGGGIGDLAIRYGYQRYEPEVMFICVIVLVLLVQIFQIIGDSSAKQLDKSNK